MTRCLPHMLPNCEPSEKFGFARIRSRTPIGRFEKNIITV
ncbi:MAG: hypothetical protein KatS3mg109_0703 [Pirellulaceae bacterium]|nr:MAG: hypothetical protein KatS3mg109_0703 [Pirellulaceae bacterium]